MNWIKLIVVLGVMTASGLSKLVPIIDELYEICVEPEESAEIFDFSGLQIIVEDDTHVYLNGTLRLKNEIKAPWEAIVSLEKFDRDQWNIQGMYKKIPDFCLEIQNPLMPWYRYSSRFKKKHCPFPAGVRIIKCKL